MLAGRLPRVIYHQVQNVYEDSLGEDLRITFGRRVDFGKQIDFGRIDFRRPGTGGMQRGL